MVLRPGVQLIEDSAVEGVRKVCKSAGARIFEFTTAGVIDRDGFFQAVRSTFPLDPPVSSSRSWDALSDSLWEGLFTLQATPIAVFWSGSEDFAVSVPVEYEVAKSVFEDITRSLSDPAPTVGKPRLVSVFIS